MGRRFFAELVGTFMIVFAPVAYASHGESGLVGAALVSGLAVTAMIYAFGPISAAHFNPAVTLGFAVARRFPWKYVPTYWGAQFLGGSLAALFAWLLFQKVSGAHIPARPELVLTNVGIELAIGFLLMLVIIAVATDGRVPAGTPALAIGLTVVCGVLIGGPITGGSMNPARSFGPALFVPGAMPYYWLYFVGPCLGAVIAAWLYERLRLEPEHAVSAPADLG